MAHRRHRIGVAAVVAAVLGAGRAGAQCFDVEQLTDNDKGDNGVRLNDVGQIVWQGTTNLVGNGSDYEIFLYEDGQITQLTDNTAADIRPVINNAGQMAWTGDYSLANPSDDDVDPEVYFWDRAAGGEIQQLTDDPREARYPYIATDGRVTWAAEGGTDDSGGGTDDFEAFYWDGQEVRQITDDGCITYWPKIVSELEVIIMNAGDPASDVCATDIVVVDTEGEEVQRFDVGNNDKRPVMNRPGQVVFEACCEEGEQSEIALFDGEEVRIISEDGVHAERPWLNDAGLVVWSGEGGRDAAQSGEFDLEVFLYDPSSGQTIQITDNDSSDDFPVINNAESPQIVWYGAHDLAGASKSNEIFLATVYRAVAGVARLTAEVNDGGEVVIEWCDATEGASTFEIQRRFSDGEWAPLGQADAGATMYVDATAADGSVYFYRVRATELAATDDWSISAQVVIPAVGDPGDGDNDNGDADNDNDGGSDPGDGSGGGDNDNGGALPGPPLPPPVDSGDDDGEPPDNPPSGGGGGGGGGGGACGAFGMVMMAMLCLTMVGWAGIRLPRRNAPGAGRASRKPR